MLDANLLKRLADIFDKNDWTDGYRHFNSYKKLFDAVCDFLLCLDDHGKELALRFFSQYRLITSYTKPLHAILDAMPINFFENIPVYFFPIKETTDTAVKSSHSVVYELTTCRIFPDNVEPVEDIFSGNIGISPNHKYVAIDDFVGTGDQFQAAIDHLIARGVSPNQISLIVIVIQKYAYDRIVARGIQVFAGEVRARAITDSYAIGNFVVPLARQIYSNMASNLDLDPAEVYGYAASEALVSMKKTPDNTLAVFWWTVRKGGGQWPAPFPR